MPAKSIAQQKLFQLAEHKPDLLSGKNAKLANLPHKTLHDFASGSEKDKPYKVRRKVKYPSPKK